MPVDVPKTGLFAFSIQFASYWGSMSAKVRPEHKQNNIKLEKTQELRTLTSESTSPVRNTISISPNTYPRYVVINRHRKHKLSVQQWLNHHQQTKDGPIIHYNYTWWSRLRIYMRAISKLGSLWYKGSRTTVSTSIIQHANAYSLSVQQTEYTTFIACSTASHSWWHVQHPTGSRHQCVQPRGLKVRSKKNARLSGVSTPTTYFPAAE